MCRAVREPLSIAHLILIDAVVPFQANAHVAPALLLLRSNHRQGLATEALSCAGTSLAAVAAARAPEAVVAAAAGAANKVRAAVALGAWHQIKRCQHAQREAPACRRVRNWQWCSGPALLLLLGLLELLVGLVLLLLRGAAAGHMEVPVCALRQHLLLLHRWDLGCHGNVAVLDCAGISCRGSCHGALFQAAQQLVFQFRNPVSNSLILLNTNSCCLLCWHV